MYAYAAQLTVMPAQNPVAEYPESAGEALRTFVMNVTIQPPTETATC